MTSRLSVYFIVLNLWSLLCLFDRWRQLWWCRVWSVCQCHRSIKMLILNGRFQHWLIAATCQENQSTNKPNVVVQSHLTHTILKNDTSSELYTGLPHSVFFDHVAFLQQFDTANFKMHITDQTLITLMDLNLLQGDLAEGFAVSQGVLSRILSYWIETMAEHMRNYIPWLPRETIQNTMPQCFKEMFPNTTCIIDCSETTHQKAHNLHSRGESFSHYYSSNTPCGGRCSDKFITQNSGFLEYLRPGDDVMADRGFTIRDLLYERKVNLAIPAFC